MPPSTGTSQHDSQATGRQTFWDNDGCEDQRWSKTYENIAKSLEMEVPHLGELLLGHGRALRQRSWLFRGSFGFAYQLGRKVRRRIHNHSHAKELLPRSRKWRTRCTGFPRVVCRTDPLAQSRGIRNDVGDEFLRVAAD